MTKIVAHRGLHKSAPENSLESFLAAARAGIPWVECDVWPSADGVPVVIHDQTLDRTTASTGKVIDHSFAQLAALGLPSLADVLSALGGKTPIVVEIKPPDSLAFVGTVRAMLQRNAGAWMIQSFYPEDVAATPEWALLVNENRALQHAVTGKWPNIHARHSLINRELVQQLHGAGRTIGAWTVNSPEDISRLIDLGIDTLITDEPELAATLIATRSRATSAAAAKAAEGAAPSVQTP